MSASLTIQDIARLAAQALVRHGASEGQAASLAAGIAAAERDGIPAYGLAWLPACCEQLAAGKVVGTAIPVVARPGLAAVVVDAGAGFAHAAIEAGLPDLVAVARRYGVASLAVRNSFDCGVLGHHAEPIAAAGLLGLGFANAPAALAPWGGRRPVLGPNPWALAAPDGAGGVRLLIDQSAAAVGRGELARRAAAGEPIPEGLALDAEGLPTTDPAAGLKGTLAPAGGHKGVGAALLVEVLAACLAGAVPGIAASPFTGAAGGPPRTGQFFLALDPAASSGGAFADRLAMVLDALAAEPGARLPGSRRLAAREAALRNGVTVDEALRDSLFRLAGEEVAS